jgi:hypothetical protein
VRICRRRRGAHDRTIPGTLVLDLLRQQENSARRLALAVALLDLARLAPHADTVRLDEPIALKVVTDRRARLVRATVLKHFDRIADRVLRGLDLCCGLASRRLDRLKLGDRSR